MDRSQFRWRLLRQAILQKKAKALLIILAVGMGASVVTALLNLRADLRYRMNRELRDYGPNVILTADPKSNASHLTESLMDSLKTKIQAGTVLAYTPQIFVPVEAGGQATVMIGANLTSLARLYPGWNLETSSSEGMESVYVGIRLGKRLKLKKGSELRITVSGEEAQMKVAGFLESGEAEDDQLFVPLATAQRLSHNQGKFHIVALSVLGEIPGVQKEFDAFIRSQPGVAYQIIRKIAAAETVILEKISKLMTMVIALILVILFFCIHTTVSTILLYRQREIALFRVLGARRKQIMSELTLELLVLGLTGGIFGFLIGIFMAQVLGRVLFQTYIVPRLDIFLITILSSLTMMVLSSVLPLRRALNRQAAVVLKEA